MHRTKVKYENKQRAITKKKKKKQTRVMLRTKFKYENKQRAITQKLSKQELWFLCTALRLDEIYPPMKFHNRS